MAPHPAGAHNAPATVFPAEAYNIQPSWGRDHYTKLAVVDSTEGNEVLHAADTPRQNGGYLRRHLQHQNARQEWATWHVPAKPPVIFANVSKRDNKLGIRVNV